MAPLMSGLPEWNWEDSPFSRIEIEPTLTESILFIGNKLQNLNR